MDIKPGDIFLTRNSEAVGNDTPGYWNHAAIYVGDNKIVEAQEDSGVILVEGYYFCERYPEYTCIRLNCVDGNKMASYAKQLVGLPYRKSASIFVFLRREERGENCVSVVRKSYIGATGIDPKWRVPDDILKHYHKKIL